MIGIDTKDHYLVVSEQNINFSGLSHSSEAFARKPLKWDPNHEEGKPSKFLLFNQVLAFLYMSANSVLFFTTFLKSLNWFQESDWISLTTISAFFALLFQILVLLIYRFVVKYYYWRTFGLRIWHKISNIYLIAIFLFGITFGVGFLVWSHLYSYPETVEDVWLLLSTLFMIIVANLLRNPYKENLKS